MLTSDDWLSFSQFPNIQPEDYPVLSAQNSYLTGEHDRIIKKFEATNQFLENTNLNEIIKRGNQRKSLREIHRVAYLVQKITEDSLLVCNNAFALNYTENLLPTQNYKLPWKELESLENYFHFRKPSEAQIRRYMALKTEDPSINFLESCKNEDQNFSISKDYIGTTFFIKSMIWPGFVNYARSNSNEFGHVYFGYGLKNADIHFTLK